MAARVDGRRSGAWGGPRGGTDDPAVAVAPRTFPQVKEQQLVFLLVRQLATAQFDQAQPALSPRLWEEVEALGIDPDRITWLLYGGQDLGDRAQLAALDQQWRQREMLERQRLRRPQLWARGWRRDAVRTPATWHRTAPPAAPRAHP